MVTINQKPTTDTKIKRKEPKHKNQRKSSSHRENIKKEGKREL